MAKFKPGPVAGQLSGSIAASTFSRNRYGPYIRARAVPTKSFTSAAMAAKSRLTSTSQGWASLTAPQRLAWNNWAGANPVIDALGEKQELTGHACYVQLNTRILVAGGTVIATPPLVAAPAPLTTLSATWDIGAGAFELTFTPTPVGATAKLWLTAAVVNNLSKVYVQNLLRFVAVSAANQATGYDTQSVIEARLGALSVGQKVTLYVAVFVPTKGLISAPLRVDGTIVST
jgi:hypothetical protein